MLTMQRYLLPFRRVPVYTGTHVLVPLGRLTRNDCGVADEGVADET